MGELHTEGLERPVGRVRRFVQHRPALKRVLRAIVYNRPIFDFVALLALGVIYVVGGVVEYIQKKRARLWINGDLTERAAQSVLFPRYSAFPAKLERRVPDESDHPV